ncbi:alpha/beta fold hydrolase [Taibaiella chishuiensis]|uniref:Pimeloyl-ACP methyl ester carboxylesterase n=1 Tax=Taibaiella chishuiensis TaxID=1434707 RepID=A0A2P8D8B2_9BACT|nr:alpha/beta fold hydrolase [Taibaiella chishuiensis]PSK93464.1 pimeloyl-ACP methyl ester carboxylesterase [Taibaiella chishuiensis]
MISSGIQQQQPYCGYATVNGISMYYERYGDTGGIPLVFIHGGGSTIPSNWSDLLPLFTPHYPVIAMELQAHGRSGDRDAPESFAQDAADVLALLDHLAIDKAIFIGFSDGACTTLELAIHHPARVDKIVVISGNYKRTGMVPGFFEELEQVSFAGMPQVLKEAYLQVNPSEEGLLNMFHKDKARRLAFSDWTDENLVSISAPALLIVGDRDVITVAHMHAMAGLIPGGRLAVLPGTHGSFIGEALTKVPHSPMSQITAGIIRAFIDTVYDG